MGALKEKGFATAEKCNHMNLNPWHHSTKLQSDCSLFCTKRGSPCTLTQWNHTTKPKYQESSPKGSLKMGETFITFAGESFKYSGDDEALIPYSSQQPLDCILQF